MFNNCFLKSFIRKIQPILGCEVRNVFFYTRIEKLSFSCFLIYQIKHTYLFDWENRSLFANSSRKTQLSDFCLEKNGSFFPILFCSEGFTQSEAFTLFFMQPICHRPWQGLERHRVAANDTGLLTGGGWRRKPTHGLQNREFAKPGIAESPAARHEKVIID